MLTGCHSDFCHYDLKNLLTCMHAGQTNRISDTKQTEFTTSFTKSSSYSKTRVILVLRPPFLFVQLSVLNLFQCGDPTALPSRGATEHCRLCSSLQTYFCSLAFDDSLTLTGSDLKTVLDLVEPSGPGSLLSSQHTLTFKP